jgi:hypothetical protein
MRGNELLRLIFVDSEKLCNNVAQEQQADERIEDNHANV